MIRIAVMYLYKILFGQSELINIETENKRLKEQLYIREYKKENERLKLIIAEYDNQKR
jgi:hypothetical protein